MNFTGGYRSGVQIDRNAPKRAYKYTKCAYKYTKCAYKYTKKDCDLILGIDTRTSECYIIPIEDTQEWSNAKSLSQLQYYKENWQILIDLALE
ncbi:hypothetical protein ckin22_00330 [Helicobacter pylori]|nr:hypothetical protein KVD78_01695 [Helicobacter pylori]